VFFSTALASGIFTFMMGLLVNVPVALAPGMGCAALRCSVHTPHTLAFSSSRARTCAIV
jgi:AGZA family xanthine/uracil permease-like MFS transporter